MKVLIIGYGSIGKRHLQILQSNCIVEEIVLVTKQFIDGYKTFRNLETVSHLESYDYFIIASETYKHYEQLKFLEEVVCCKSILVEKPIFERYYEMEAIKNNVFVAYNLRFHPVVTRIKQIIATQKVLYVNVLTGQYLPTWRPGTDYRNCYSALKEHGGGVLLDLSHEIDYIQWLFGKFKNLAAINKKISDLEINSDDIVTSIGITERDIIVNFTMDYLSKIPVRNITVQTNELTLIGDLVGNKLLIGTKDKPVESESFVVERNFTYQRMHQAILEKKTEGVCSYNEGIDVLKTIEMVKKLQEVKIA